MGAFEKAEQMRREAAASAQRQAQEQAVNSAEAKRQADIAREKAKQNLHSSGAVQALGSIAGGIAQTNNTTQYTINAEGTRVDLSWRTPGATHRISAGVDPATQNLDVNGVVISPDKYQSPDGGNIVDEAAAKAYLKPKTYWDEPVIVYRETTNHKEAVGDETCCHCLSKGTMILTSEGLREVEKVKVGDRVYSVNKSGKKVLRSIINTAKVKAGNNHKMLFIELANGISIKMSVEHPDKNGLPMIEAVKKGELNGIEIKDISLVSYMNRYTYDLLTDGENGVYFANGILLGSTLSSNFQHSFCSHSAF